ncbi:MAG: hypothetical protein ACLP50_07900 [Solirubrobacteraceae bacterium]
MASIEGAVTKKILMFSGISDSTTPPAYRIWVANRELGKQEFNSPEDLYESAPSAGMVRLFYLPLSRHVVNLECLPDAPVDDISPATVRQVLVGALSSWRSHDKIGQAEARARMEAIGHAAERYVSNDRPASGQQNQVALAEAIVGAWSSPLVDLSFHADGTLEARRPGRDAEQGSWSVDSSGRLHADVMGFRQVAEASVADDQLSLGISGRWLKLRRASSD